MRAALSLPVRVLTARISQLVQRGTKSQLAPIMTASCSLAAQMIFYQAHFELLLLGRFPVSLASSPNSPNSKKPPRLMQSNRSFLRQLSSHFSPTFRQLSRPIFAQLPSSSPNQAIETPPARPEAARKARSASRKRAGASKGAHLGCLLARLEMRAA